MIKRAGIARDVAWLARFFREALFPRLCTGCGREGEWFCSSCCISLTKALPVCPICWKESDGGARHGSCVGTPDGILALWEHEGVVRKGIELIRHCGTPSVAADLVRFWLEALGENPSRYAPFLSFLSMAPPVSFVPLHSAAFRRQGFNHAESVALVFARGFKLSIRPLLQKQDARASQLGLDPVDRVNNPRGAFALQRGVSVPSSVLLVDDTLGSGATMQECCSILKNGGAKEVWGCVLARGL